MGGNESGCFGVAEKRRNHMRWIFLVAAVWLCVLTLQNVTVMIAEYQENHSGIPDCVSSFSMMGEEYLVVVANSDWIPDREEFARTVIQMCRDNLFRSILFSTDKNGYPKSLEIKAYYRREHIGKYAPVCRIEYKPDKWDAGYDIYHDAEHYTLCLDGLEIDENPGVKKGVKNTIHE